MNPRQDELRRQIAETQTRSSTRRRYDEGVKEAAVEYIRDRRDQGVPMTRIGKDLGLSKMTCRRWLRQAEPVVRRGQLAGAGGDQGRESQGEAPNGEGKGSARRGPS